MRKLLPLLLICVLSISCKKYVEKQKEEIAMDIITNGYWKVEYYTEDAIDMTAAYNGYEFKFNDNETLNAIKPGSTLPGTWKANIADYSITTDFPGSALPISSLNGLWKLKDSGSDFVKAENTQSGVTKFLHLRKK